MPLRSTPLYRQVKIWAGDYIVRLPMVFTKALAGSLSCFSPNQGGVMYSLQTPWTLLEISSFVTSNDHELYALIWKKEFDNQVCKMEDNTLGKPVNNALFVYRLTLQKSGLGTLARWPCYNCTHPQSVTQSGSRWGSS